MTPAAIAESLRRDAIFDPETRLRPGGRDEVEKALERAAADGLRAYVVLAPGGDPEALRAVWGELGLDPRVDLLLIWTDGRWEARGWGLDDAVIARELDAAEPALAQYLGKGLATAVERLDAVAVNGAPLAPAAPAVEPGMAWSSLAALSGAGLLAAGLAAGLGFVLLRRSRRAAEDRQLADARRTAEHAIAELLLTADDLGRDQALELQTRAARLSEELARVARLDEPLEVREGRIRQVGNEVAALQSTVLQRQPKKGSPT